MNECLRSATWNSKGWQWVGYYFYWTFENRRNYNYSMDIEGINIIVHGRCNSTKHMMKLEILH